MQIGELNDAIVALRVEKIHQRSAPMLVGIGDGVAHPRGLVTVFLLVGLEQRDVALDLLVG